MDHNINEKSYVLPVVKPKKTKGTLKKILKGLMLFTGASLAAIETFPVEEVKTHEEIKQSIDLLEANDCYYSSINPKVYKNTGKVMDEIVYNPLVLPKGTEKINIIVEDSFNEDCEKAIQDTLEEFNSVLKAANQKFYFEYTKENITPKICDIVVKKFESNKNNGTYIHVPLPNEMDLFSTISVNENCTEYNEFRMTFSHELLHYFGAGDLYMLDDETRQSVDSIMNGITFQMNVLKANDIKYIFATLDDVTTQADVDRVNNYIDYHLTKFNYINQQSDRLLAKVGEEHLLKQIQHYTKESATLNYIDVSNEIILLDQINYYAKWASPINADIKGVRIDNEICSMINMNKENIIANEWTRNFWDDYVIFQYGDKYTLFDKRGELLNLFKPTSKVNYYVYAKKIQEQTDEMTN